MTWQGLLQMMGSCSSWKNNYLILKLVNARQNISQATGRPEHQASCATGSLSQTSCCLADSCSKRSRCGSRVSELRHRQAAQQAA